MSDGIPPTGTPIERPASGTAVRVAATVDGFVFLALVGVEHAVQVELSPAEAAALAEVLAAHAEIARSIVEGG